MDITNLLEVFVALLVGYILRSYLSEKGKNLATKEDIAGITHQIESVKTEYARVLEEVRSDNQLKHAEIAREKAIRKEVYLQAMESMSRVQLIFSDYINLNLSEEQIGDVFSKNAGAIGKISLVGSEETIAAFTAIMDEISKHSLVLTMERNTLLQRKATLESLGTGFQSSTNEIDRLLGMMKEANLAGNTNQQFWNMLDHNFQFESQHREELRQQMDELWGEQNRDLLSFTALCMSCASQVANMMPAAVLSIRKELDLPISEEVFLNTLGHSRQRRKNQIDNYLARLSGIQVPESQKSDQAAS